MRTVLKGSKARQDPSPLTVETRNQRIAGYLLLTLYLCLIVPLTYTHTFWRDETQAWLVARASHSIHGLLRNIRYEGHPPLWYLVLYMISRFTGNPEWMKLPNLLCSIASALLIFRSKHVPLWIRAGLILSYYMLFEYALIDRNYMIGLMLLLIAASRIRRHGSADPWVFAALSLAALTSLPALAVSTGVAAYCIALAQPFFSLKTRSNTGLIGIAAFTLCCLYAIAATAPPADYSLFPPVAFYRRGLALNLQQAGHSIAIAYLPNQIWQRGFWNHAAIDSLPPLVAALSGWLLLGLLCLLFHDRSTRIFFASTSALIVLILCVTQVTYLRQVGWLFVVLLLALLLDRPRSPKDHGLWRNLLLGAILTAQVTAGLFACAVSLRYSFSPSKQAATYLLQHNLQNAVIVPVPEFIGSAPIAYLQRPTNYSLASRQEAPFLLWNRKTNQALFRFLQLQQLLPSASPGRPVVVIAMFPLAPWQIAANRLHLLAAFTGGICAADTYYLYQAGPALKP
jgi:hypothetical protein